MFKHPLWTPFDSSKQKKLAQKAPLSASHNLFKKLSKRIQETLITPGNLGSIVRESCTAGRNSTLSV